MAEEIIQEYDAKLDSKHRCVIHGIPSFDRYHVKVFGSGKIEMTPRVLASPEELSENTLKMIYSSIRNLKDGNAGSTIDFDKYQEYLKEDQ
jgi:hypothetical protein